MVSQIFVFAIAVWFAFRLKRHPEKDGNMKKVMAEQRGTEYEKRMQNFFMVNYLTAALALTMAALIQIIFGLNEGVVELDEERKAAMVSNLMVVLCADESAQPVVNTGSLY